MLLFLLPVLGSLRASAAAARQWPSEPKHDAHPLDAVLGAHSAEMDPDRVDKISSQPAPAIDFTFQEGVYVIGDRVLGKYLDAYVLPKGSVGAAHEAFVTAPALTLTQEWLIYQDGADEQGKLYAIVNRASGHQLRLEASGPVVIGAAMRWRIEGDFTGYTISAVDGRQLAANGAGEFYCNVVPKGQAAKRWKFTLTDSVPESMDLSMGYSPPMPAGAAEIPAGVYDIRMELGHLSACTQPTCGSGDYEASASPAVVQQWGIIPSKGGRGGPVYEIREAETGLMLDAYLFGFFRSMLRGDDRKVSQRWVITPLDGGKFALAQLADLRYLSLVERAMDGGAPVGAAVTTDRKVGWTLDFKGPLPAHLIPAPPPVCKTECDAGLECGEMPDGCGKMVQCGACHEAATCSAQNQCLCEPYSCELTMCGAVPDGCGAEMDCGICGDGMMCDDISHACVAAPEVPVLPDLALNGTNGAADGDAAGAAGANETDGIVDIPPVPEEECACAADAIAAAVADAMAAAAEQMAACGCGENATNATAPAEAAPAAPEAAAANATPNATEAPAPPGDGRKTVEEIMRELAPTLLARLRPVLVNATVHTVLGLKNTTDPNAVSSAVLANLTDDAIVAAAKKVVIPDAELLRIKQVTTLVAEKAWNQTFANATYNNEVLPEIIANFTMGQNDTTEEAENRSAALKHMVELTDRETAPEVMRRAQLNATVTAAHAALAIVNKNQAKFGVAAYEKVKAATISIASDVAVNTLTYDVEKDVLRGVEFKPEDVMFRTKRALHKAGAAQEVAADVQPLLLTRLDAVVNAAQNATNGTALAARGAARKLRLRRAK